MSLHPYMLVIEQGDFIARHLTPLMSNHGIDVEVSHDPGDLLSDGKERAAQALCILIEVAADAPAPVGLVDALRRQGCAAPIIALVHASDGDCARALLDAGATDVVDVPLIYAYVMNRLDDLASGAGSTDTHKLTLRDGTAIAFRFLHPRDADIEQAFVRGLSDRSRYLRFLSFFRELPAHLLESLTHNDFPRSYAVIATVSLNGVETQIGVARYAPTDESDTAEFAVVVADDWQGSGVATCLMHIVILAAAAAGYARLDGIVLRENTPMLRLAEKLGFRPLAGYADGPGVLRIRKPLVHTPDTTAVVDQR